MLTVLALLVSLMGLARTSALASERMDQLQVAWAAVQDGSVEGTELVVTDRLMRRLRLPVPAMRNAAYWSLGLTLLSMVLFAWFIASRRSADDMMIAAEEGREQSEKAAILKLLDEIAPLASGDLRVRATVGDTLTGSVADSFNFALSELRWLVGTMDHSVLQINDAIERSLNTAESVTRACSEQSGEIHRSSNQLVSMNGALAEVTADATAACSSAQASVEQVERGLHALSISFNRMAIIRNEAESTTRLMSRMTDNVSAIEERVSVVQEVAKRTDLLALNATIKASASTNTQSASDATADLGRLSAEVAQLAEVLGQATRDISTLAGTISRDATDTVKSMHRSSVELDEGGTQIQKAGEVLNIIRQNSDSLRQRVVAMADKSAAQTGIVRQLSENMDVINHITRQTSDAVTGNADSLGELADLSAELKQSLSDFNLPPRPSREGSRDMTADASSQARKAADRAAIHG
ncbi:methyl-accepting chemotaxis protein [Granulosicoccus antarcticus]|nr:methyl-accepting chemotaxis protein [Granulosicoccus antarcticus]